jgi:hypothetical protein
VLKRFSLCSWPAQFCDSVWAHSFVLVSCLLNVPECAPFVLDLCSCARSVSPFVVLATASGILFYGASFTSSSVCIQHSPLFVPCEQHFTDLSRYGQSGFPKFAFISFHTILRHAAGYVVPSPYCSPHSLADKSCNKLSQMANMMAEFEHHAVQEEKRDLPRLEQVIANHPKRTFA